MQFFIRIFKYNLAIYFSIVHIACHRFLVVRNRRLIWYLYHRIPNLFLGFSILKSLHAQFLPLIWGYFSFFLSLLFNDSQILLLGLLFLLQSLFIIFFYFSLYQYALFIHYSLLVLTLDFIFFNIFIFNIFSF